ncbi:sulfotransferase domain-containing protein [Roseomonas sp. BU-1]|uniref:Sulfotransferase domain-containing protein n=1 Tax=Falsiroseomonas selenitidurans TaxID=2716335 RepID=A0ABX1E6S2_9PROT|nr:sulfotransferase domain-containing protein [Falsiroseomonas selenitidurans]
MQKSATSALFHALRAHRGMAPARTKEVHYFDREQGVDWSAPDYAAYHAEFPDRPGLWLEATPIYIFWPPSIARMRAYSPALRQIYLFRDPIERCFSHWCWEYARQAELLDFPAAIEAEPARLAAAAPLDDQRRVVTYQARGLYAGQVERLLAHFPREQLLFLSQAELRTQPLATLRRVTDFLEIDAILTPPAIRNPRPKRDYPSRLTAGMVERLQPVFRDDLRRFADLTGLDVQSWLTLRGPSALPEAG